ncbi:MAG: RsmE family RNA methyltransferase [Planctomycetota bacterium]
MPARFHCESLPDPALPDPRCELSPDESRHARRVLRLSAGDTVELFDGRGGVASATLTGFGKSGAVCRVDDVRRVPRPTPRVTVASAVPKGPRAEDMVNQLGQLGVGGFVPVVGERSVVEPGEGKRARFERAALAATKQSGRAWTMAVGSAVGLSDWLRESAGVEGPRLILDPGGETGPAVLGGVATAAEVAVLVGPEGGWADGELAAAEAAGYVRWRLAEHVLRVETAAVAAAAVVGQAVVSA